MRALIVSMALLLATPGLAGEGRQAPLRVVMPHSMNQPDPHLDPTVVGSAILANVYESLVSIEEGGQPAPELATSWEPVDGRAWRFHLRSEVRFHDGSPLAASAVAASIERARSLPQSKLLASLRTVARAVAEDAATVRVDLAEDDPLLLTKLAGLVIVPAGSPEAITEPVGTGPYRWSGRAEDGTLRLEAFSDYWGTAPHEGSVEIRFDDDQAAGLAELRRGEVDILTSLSSSLVEEVESDPGLVVDSALGSTVTFLVLNHRRPPFSDPLVREAVDAAIDRSRIADGVYRRYARPARQMVSEKIFGYHPGLSGAGRDLARARALVEAVLPEAVPRFTLLVVPSEGNRELSGELRQQLAEAGLAMEVEELPWPALWERLQSGEIDAAILGWTSSAAEAGSIFSTFFETMPIGPSDPTLERLVATCQSPVDRELRDGLYRAIAERIAEGNVYLPLVWGMELYAVRRGILWEPGPRGELQLAAIERR